MTFFKSALIGAAVLSAAAMTTLPAEARGGVAIQIGPGGVSIGVDQYRDYCRDYSYRHRYYDNCNRYSFNDAYYVDRGEYYRWQQRHRRHHHRHHHYDYSNDRYYDYGNDRDYYRDRY